MIKLMKFTSIYILLSKNKAFLRLCPLSLYSKCFKVDVSFKVDSGHCDTQTFLWHFIWALTILLYTEFLFNFRKNFPYGNSRLVNRIIMSLVNFSIWKNLSKIKKIHFFVIKMYELLMLQAC